jgi:hypothetical protein
MFNPSKTTGLGEALTLPFLHERMSPEARIAFAAAFGSDGTGETSFSTTMLRESASGGRLWPLVYLLISVIALGSLCVILAILLAMIGFGAWFKAAALRAGIAPDPEPECSEPSPAFKEDCNQYRSGIIAKENSESTGE